MRLLAKSAFVFGWLLLMGWGAIAPASVTPTWAHGVRLTYQHNPITGEITVRAMFDTGDVMNDAQVAVFAPDDLVNPWQTGTTDDNGEYTFLPDYTIEGTWDVQIRKAGHGGLINIAIDASMAPNPDASDAAVASTIRTAEDGSEIVIDGNATLRINGDVIITASGGVVDNSGGTSDSLTDGMSQTQIVVMSASVIWGFVGTALFFSQRRKGNG